MDPQELHKIIKDALSEGVSLDLTTLLLLVVLIGLANYLGSYLRNKGSNTATKEDINEITDKIESVKTQYAQKMEILSHENRVILSQLQQRHELKLAALDKRLAVHQEAYTLWWRLMGVTSDRVKASQVVQESQEWYVENSLYLTEKSRDAFHEAYMGTILHPELLLDKVNNAKEIKENFMKIRAAGSKIVESVSLPSWGDKEYAPIEEPNK